MKITLWINGMDLGKGQDMAKRKGTREPNGRLSRKAEHASEREWETAREARSVAVEARMRVFGVSEEHAKDERAGTLFGRMALDGRISLNQWEAAGKYIETRSSYHRAIDTKPWHNEGRQERESIETYEDFVKRSREKHEAMEAIIAEVCMEERCQLPRQALDMIVCRDIQAPFLDGYLRSVLNRLHAHFFMEKRKAA